MFSRETYRDEYDLHHPSLTAARYRDYYERDRYEERAEARLAAVYHRSAYTSPPPLEDSYYRSSTRRVEDPHAIQPPLPSSRSSRSERTREIKGAYVQGSVTLAPPPLFSNKAPTREKPSNCNTVFVGTLPEGTTEKNLYDIFCECGAIQDVRIARNKTFGHVEFKYESSVEKAILLNRFTVIVTSSSGGESSASIQVDYAQSRELSDAKRRMKSGDMLPFNAANAQIIAGDLRNDDTFDFSAKNLVQWLEKGSCTATTAGTFFSLLSAVNIHSFKLEKDMKAKDREEDEFFIKKRKYLEQLLLQCNTLESVFEAALLKKAWDNFTKPQRKTMTQWKDHIKELEGSIQANIKSSVSKRDKSSEEPATKKLKIDTSQENTASKVSELESKLARAEKEIDQLKLDHEVAVEKSEKQILQLKTLLAKFKKNCPEEWEKIVTGGSGGATNNHQDNNEQQDEMVKEESGDEGEGEGEWEVIDGVSMDDLNRALDNGAAGGETLASAAAAYAQLKTQMGSSADEKGLLSDTEIALVSVMAAFLTVHPLGASLEEIELYFRALNVNYNMIYLESLLHRLPVVFHQSKSTPDSKPRWWFMGFQSVSVSTQFADSQIIIEDTDLNNTVEMIDVVTGDSAD